jgi:hypothetical protein
MTDEPLLGLATTRQLLEELEARGECEHVHPMDGRNLAIIAKGQLENLPVTMLDYRTVGGE